MLLIVDNNDSFTYNLVDLFHQFRKRCMVRRSGAINLNAIDETDLSGIVFSPGPQTPREHPVMFRLLEKYANSGIPVLGICLGYQAIGMYYGGKLNKMQNPLHGKVSMLSHNNDQAFEGIPEEFPVMHYHSLYIDEKESAELITTSKTKDGMPMSFTHKDLPVSGFQFHPESIQTGNGYILIYNWLKKTEKQYTYA